MIPPESTSSPLPVFRKQSYYSDAAEVILANIQEDSPDTFQILFDKQLHADVCRWMAKHFPLRHAVWWCLICIETSEGPESVGSEISPYLVKWVVEPSETIRTQILMKTWQESPEKAVDFLAKAVVWAGPSMTPAHLPPVQADRMLPSVMVSAAILNAAANHFELEFEEAIQQFIKIGLLVDSGKMNWNDPQNKSFDSQNNSRPQGLYPY